MRSTVVAFFSSLVLMMIMDGLWFTVSLNNLYKPGIGHLMGDKLNLPAALLFYVMYAACATYLVTLPALASGQLSQAVIRGAVLGLIAYGTYDLTSLAVLRAWPLNVTVADMIWGMVITGVTAGFGFFMARKFG
jgi:uncharacterized membrane protein